VWKEILSRLEPLRSFLKLFVFFPSLKVFDIEDEIFFKKISRGYYLLVGFSCISRMSLSSCNHSSMGSQSPFGRSLISWCEPLLLERNHEVLSLCFLKTVGHYFLLCLMSNCPLLFRGPPRVVVVSVVVFVVIIYPLPFVMKLSPSFFIKLYIFV